MEFNENNLEPNENDVESNENNPVPENQETGENNSKEGKGLWAEVFEWIQAIVVAVVIAMFLRTFVFTLVNVSGESMLPTLHDADKLVVWRLGYEPKVGDVIIFRPRGHENTPYVKRVIALAGQTVDIRLNAQGDKYDVFVDNKKLDEKYIREPINKNHLGNMKYPLVVPEDSVFAMGDNRNNSMDSRFSNVGTVDNSSIIGKAVTRLLPVSDFGAID